MRRFLYLVLSLVALVSLSAQCQSTHNQLRDGKPIGVWEYYDGKELGLRFDYDSSRIQYIRPDTARYLVRVDTTWQVRQLYRAPRVLGSNSEMIGIVQQTLRYPLQDIRNRVSGTVVLTYVIDEKGLRTNPIVVTTPSKTLAEEVYKAVESAQFFYLPAIYQGRRVPVKIAFVVRFCFCKKMGDECRKVIKEQVLRVPKPLGYAGEVVVTTFVN